MRQTSATPFYCSWCGTLYGPDQANALVACIAKHEDVRRTMDEAVAKLGDDA